MIKFLQDVYYYFSNLDNYVWTDDNNRIVLLLEKTWFYGFYVCPLVTYCYLDEINNVENKPANIYCVNRFEFISIMHIHK